MPPFSLPRFARRRDKIARARFKGFSRDCARGGAGTSLLPDPEARGQLATLRLDQRTGLASSSSILLIILAPHFPDLGGLIPLPDDQRADRLSQVTPPAPLPLARTRPTRAALKIVLISRRHRTSRRQVPALTNIAARKAQMKPIDLKIDTLLTTFSSGNPIAG